MGIFFADNSDEISIRFRLRAHFFHSKQSNLNSSIIILALVNTTSQLITETLKPIERLIDNLKIK